MKNIQQVDDGHPEEEGVVGDAQPVVSEEVEEERTRWRQPEEV